MKKVLYCSPNKKLCGVCGGIADYFNVDPTLIRLGVVLIALVTAVLPMLIVYFIVALIVPKAPDNYFQLYNNTSRRITKSFNKKLCGVCGGFAEWLDMDPTIIRILFVLLTFLFGSSAFFYIACAILMPKPVEPYDRQPYTAPGDDPNAWQYGSNPNDRNSENPGSPQNGRNNTRM